MSMNLCTIKRVIEVDVTLPEIDYVTIPSEEEIENAETDISFATADPNDAPVYYYLRTPGEEENMIKVAHGPEVGDEDWEQMPDWYDFYGDDFEPGGGTGNRPELVFKSSLYDAGLQAGDSFTIGDYSFTVISEKIALCDSYISTDVFDSETNVYEDSEIKKRVEDWYKKEILLFM